jgi:hypothetical protein
MCYSLDDSDGLNNGRIKWHPLETVLGAWIDMVRTGKIVAEAPGQCIYGEHFHKNDPWVLLPYTAGQVNEAAGLFDSLVNAIEIRMPNKLPSSQSGKSPLFNHDELIAAKLPPGFAYDLLRKVRRPCFRFIAPGLEVPNRGTIAMQPFFGMMEQLPEQYRDNETSSPILLFRSSQLYTRPPRKPTARWDSDSILGYPFNERNYPAGLYFHSCDPSDSNAHDDGVSLILPYGIGANRWARKSDGTFLGEDVDRPVPNARNVHAELYQTGHQPFIEMHPVRLVKVLGSWLSMVENGHWQIGPDGVLNGIDTWQMADTENDWEKYWIPPDW